MEVTRAILCVDDDALILKSLRFQLERHFSEHFVFEFAQSAEEGLEVIALLQSEGIVLVVVICDYLMPGMNGQEFARIVKESHPKLDILMLSGQADNEAVSELIDERTIAVMMSKPWGEEELVARIRAMIDRDGI